MWCVTYTRGVRYVHSRTAGAAHAYTWHLASEYHPILKGSTVVPLYVFKEYLHCLEGDITQI